MSNGWNYINGDWNAVCDSCGQKLKASSLKKRWDGFMTCSGCWEPRHSQDFVRAKDDNFSVPWTRPKQSIVYINEYDPSQNVWDGEGLNLMEMN